VASFFSSFFLPPRPIEWGIPGSPPPRSLSLNRGWPKRFPFFFLLGRFASSTRYPVSFPRTGQRTGNALPAPHDLFSFFFPGDLGALGVFDTELLSDGLQLPFFFFWLPRKGGSASGATDHGHIPARVFFFFFQFGT